jgi:type IV secretory pathway component VirB8
MIEKIDLTDAQRKSRRNRNVAIAVALFALVILFYAVTIIKMVPGAGQ